MKVLLASLDLCNGDQVIDQVLALPIEFPVLHLDHTHPSSFILIFARRHRLLLLLVRVEDEKELTSGMPGMATKDRRISTFAQSLTHFWQLPEQRQTLFEAAANILPHTH